MQKVETFRGRALSLSRDWENVLSLGNASKEDKLNKVVIMERPNVEFCTGSSYTGQWNKLGMEGFGTFLFPHGNGLNNKKPIIIIIIITHNTT